MPEGDTIYRTADVMRRTLGSDVVTTARGRAGGAQLARVIGSRPVRVSSRGKHLLIDFDNKLTLHTHLGMNGSWHRYRPGERWRIARDRAVAVIETARATVVCFDAPTVELLETRALPLHPVLSKLGPDLLDDDPDLIEALERLTSAWAQDLTIAEALIDQRIVAGIGNVYRSEVLAHEGTSPFAIVGTLPAETLMRLLETSRQFLRANLGGGIRVTQADTAGRLASPGANAYRGRRSVYRRSGRPCRRCGELIRAATIGVPPRRVYWCPGCQPRKEA